MGSWIRKWHVILAVIIGVYLAIPKPVEPMGNIGNVETFATGAEFTTINDQRFTIDKAVNVNRTEIDGVEHFEFSALDIRMLKAPDAKESDSAPKPIEPILVLANEDIEKRINSSPLLQVRMPLSAYKPNLGQDLAGGTSLRYRIASGDLADATSRLYEILNGWKISGQLAATSEAFQSKCTDYMNSYINGKIIGVPGSDLLPTAEEIEAVASQGIGEDQVRALKNVVDQFEPLKNQTVKDLVEETIANLQDRLNKTGMTELNIVKAGDNEIEVKLPALPPAQLDQIKATLRTTGRLEFVLLPSEDVFGKDKTAKDVYPGLPEKDSHRFRWYDVDPAVIAAELRQSNGLTYDVGKQAFEETTKRGKDDTPAFRSRTWSVVTDRPAVKTRFTDKDGKEHIAWVTPEVCLVQVSYPKPGAPDEDLLGYPIKGTSLKTAEATTDSNTGQPAVSFELQGQGVAVMSTVTKEHISREEGGEDPRHLAVAIDRKLYSAPTINAELSDRIQVSGNFTRAEVKQYVSILKAGSLSVELMPLGEETIGPAEGADNIKRGLWALVIGASMVLLFALLFYKRTGILTMLNLLLTIVLIYAIMALFLSTITLPGIAGLVLTLGMAIDANILINERIREERRNGASGRVAIEQGFKKAFSAIIDGNVTTLITALILTKIGTGAVAGFALTLSIGILCTLYTSLLVYRTTLLWSYDRGLIPEVHGVEIFKNSKFNLVGIGKKLAIVSLVVMIAAFSLFVYDAKEGKVFGVDFRGGTQIVLQFQEPLTRDDLDAKVAELKDESGEEKYPDVMIQARAMLGDDAGADGGATRYELTFPTPVGQDIDGQAALQRAEMIEADLRGMFSDALVDEGFKPSILNPSAVDFELTFKLTSPAETEDNKEATHTWLHDAIGEDFGTISDWFSSGSGLEGTTLTRVGDDATLQTVVFSAKDVAVNDAADAESKWLDFFTVITEKMAKHPEALKIISGGLPTYSEFSVALRDGVSRDYDERLGVYARTGVAKAEVTLLRALTKEQFVTALQAEAMQSQIAAVKALNADAVAYTDPADAGKESYRFTISTPAVQLFTLSDAVGSQRSNDVVTELETIVAKLDKRMRDDVDLRSGISKPVPKTSVIGGRIAGEMQARALLALLIALIAIVIYVGIRFKSTGWGLAAVAALIQDTFLTLGAIALMDDILSPTLGFDLKIDLNAIAALLTVIGYSLNDTIVIFDRIREELVNDLNSKKERPMVDVINAAINRTLSRTVLTSVSTFVVVLAMVMIGGPAIRTFAWTLLFGLIFGTYSSVFRAGPFLLFFTGAKGDLREEIKREEEAKEEARRIEEEALAEISTDREIDEDGEGEFSESDFADADFSREAVAEAGNADSQGSADSEDSSESDEDEDKANG